MADFPMSRILPPQSRVDSPFLALSQLERAVFLAGLGLVALFVVLYALISPEGAHPIVLASFLAYVLVVALPLFRGLLRSPGFFHPLFFYGSWMGLRSLLTGDAVLAATGLDFHRALGVLGTSEFDFLIVKYFLLEALALLALYAGFAVSRKLKVPKLRPSSVPARMTLSALLWMLVPTIGVVMLAAELGLGGLLLQRGIASDQRLGAEIGGHWHILAGAGTVVPVVWLAFDRRAAVNPVFWVVSLYAALLVFVATGSRSSAIMPFITIALMWGLRNRTVPYRALWLGAFIAIVLIGVLGEFRAATREISDLSQLHFETNVVQGAQLGLEELVAGSTTNNGQIAVLGSVPQDVPYLLGRSYLSILFVPIPSVLLPFEKPDAAGKLNAALIYGNPLTGIPTTAVGEAFWNFSYFGVLAIFLLYGAFLRALTSLYLENSENALVIVVFLYVLTALLPGSNEVFNFMHRFVPVLAFFLFLIFVSRIRFRRADPALKSGAGRVGFGTSNRNQGEVI
jgi:oligosaccharide repeat unit polymerase